MTVIRRHDKKRPMRQVGGEKEAVAPDELADFWFVTGVSDDTVVLRIDTREQMGLSTRERTNLMKSIGDNLPRGCHLREIAIGTHAVQVQWGSDEPSELAREAQTILGYILRLLCEELGMHNPQVSRLSPQNCETYREDFGLEPNRWYR